MTNSKVLILVDLQNDFMPEGALPVPRGDEVIALANRLQDRFGIVLATQDWHPPDHGSFAANHPGRRPGEFIDLHGLRQVLWPVHCVQDTPGAALHPGLDTRRIERVFRKGTDPTVDSYSGFFDNERRGSTGLGEHLQALGAMEVWIAGLATDYCVKYSAIDARSLGLETVIVEDACRGVELAPGDIARAIEEMRRAGVSVVRSSDLPG